MIDCIVMGDSIAVGVSQTKQLHECREYARGGINTWQFNKMYGNHPYNSDIVVISLGSNDHKYIKTEQELVRIRSLIRAKRVYWILPAGNLRGSEVPIQNIQQIVQRLADQNGDFVVPITRLQPDGIHPSSAGYKLIAEQIK